MKLKQLGHKLTGVAEQYAHTLIYLSWAFAWGIILNSDLMGEGYSWQWFAMTGWACVMIWVFVSYSRFRLFGPRQ